MKKEKSEQEIGLTYMVTNKRGTINELMEQITFETFNGFLAVGFLRICGKDWLVTECGVEYYDSFYKKPTFIQALKGLYCHYILKI
jgi:hypothetical protein